MRTFFLIVLGMILFVVAAGAGYASYRIYSILSQNSAPSQTEYPQAAVDMLKIQFDNLRVSPPDSYNIYSFFLASQMVEPPRINKDMFNSLMNVNPGPNRGMQISPAFYLYLIDVALVDSWISFWWEDSDILRSHLGIHRYGSHEWKGLEEAAEGFFGVSVHDLSLPEMAVLVLNFRAPYGFDAFCDREGVKEGALQLLARYKETFPEAQYDADQMFARLQTRECKRGKN